MLAFFYTTILLYKGIYITHINWAIGIFLFRVNLGKIFLSFLASENG